MKHLVDRLPSGFFGYPQGIQIYYSPFTIGDLKKFFKVNSLLDIVELYVGKVEIQGVDGFSVWDLYYGDFQFLVVQIYIVSVEDTQLDLRISCKCGNSFLHTVNLLDLKFKTLDVDKVETEYKGLRLRPPKLRDMREVLDGGEEVREKLLDIYVESDKELGKRLDVDVPVGKFLKMVKQLDIGLMPIEVDCGQCGGKLEVETRLDFFTLV